MPDIRGRNWIFTLNNPSLSSEELEGKFTARKLSYIFQLEEGETNGTKHFQGVIKSINALRLSTLKDIINEAHWELCRNWVASYRYCSKSKTRIDGPWSNLPDTDVKKNLETH